MCLFSQKMGAAQTVIAVVVLEIRHPEAIHQNRPSAIVVMGMAGRAAARNNVDRIKRFGTAFAVTFFHHDVAARAALEQVVSGIHPDQGLIGYSTGMQSSRPMAALSQSACR